MRSVIWPALCYLYFLSSPTAILVADETADSEFFERKIRPVLVEYCYECHSSQGKQVEGGLRLDSREAMRRGGESGPAVSPRQLDQSLLLSALKYESLEMPPNKKLTDEVIQDFEQWIASGAYDPRDEPSIPNETVISKIDFEQGRQFWSFQSPVRHDLPVHNLGNWPRNRIDHFVAGKLHEQRLEPAPPAERAELIRRLTFDLTGLPPTLEQLRSWNTLPEESLIADVTESLLGSSAYGEHWARLWLDLMRYADDQAHIVGNDTSLFFPNSHLYRDWVIAALNDDMPFDRFVELQLAADLITPDDPSDDVALGFVGLGPKYYRRNSPEVKAEEWEDRVDVLSRGLLGLTVACARCHDHKFDPVSTADYYALAGVFASTEMFNRPLDPQRETNDKGHAKEPKDALHIIRDIEPQDLAIMIRGDVNRRGPVVPRGFLTVLSSENRKEFGEGSGRSELAREIVSRDNPLVARVFVNRVWGKLIGKPLVATPSNFGNLGQRPTHPELLDDLAVGFMENQWSLKWLCREIVNSATYQQSTRGESVEADPENRWLSRMHRKRLSVEQMRDTILLAAGRLNSSHDAVAIDPSDPQSTPRTIYCQSSRLKLNPMLALFDYPDPNVHSEARTATITATQKLFAMNSPFMVQNAQALSQRIQAENLSVRQAIEMTYLTLLSRKPRIEEVTAAIDFIHANGDNFDKYVHAVSILNEAIILD
ncbi:MAG: PSD1 and planctomycete cytochrome C domain-containing protein [Pirellulaceae bacterium]